MNSKWFPEALACAQTHDLGEGCSARVIGPAHFVATRAGETGVGILFQALAAASLWVVIEWWRSWFLTGFDWNELGISQAPSVVFRQPRARAPLVLLRFEAIAALA